MILVKRGKLCPLVPRRPVTGPLPPASVHGGREPFLPRILQEHHHLNQIHQWFHFRCPLSEMRPLTGRIGLDRSFAIPFIAVSSSELRCRD
ncbi:hypothetical protein JCGZ_12834 [Jatropha curcas]|uniref:Uncharacterized protein n=1 Tax=Jatropha curcas TaxID=180498 RepID=A0A067KPR8_JATCU|nr:hypothetical protein JCGZ_12834 [Jatropha curcas]